MSKWDKLLEKVKSGPNNVTIEELVILMKHYGFTHKKTSHGYLFKHEKLLNKILPHVAAPHGRENKVKRAYVESCLEAIELLMEE